MKSTCPRLVIAGTGSGVGKTSIALGLARALADRGLREGLLYAQMSADGVLEDGSF